MTELTIPWATFTALADSMAPVTASGVDLPILRAVRLRWHDGQCSAVASDRYQMAEFTFPATGSGEALVFGDELVRLRKMWKPDRGLDWQVVLSGSVWSCPRGTWTYTPADGSYPNVDKVWPAPDRAKGGQPYLNPRLVSSLMRSARGAGARHVLVETAEEASSPILFTGVMDVDGWGWRGLLMPIRRETVER